MYISTIRKAHFDDDDVDDTLFQWGAELQPRLYSLLWAYI